MTYRIGDRVQSAYADPGDDDPSAGTVRAVASDEGGVVLRVRWDFRPGRMMDRRARDLVPIGTRAIADADEDAAIERAIEAGDLGREESNDEWTEHGRLRNDAAHARRDLEEDIGDLTGAHGSREAWR